MKKINTKIEGLLILEPDIYTDSRGLFFELFNQKKFENLGIKEKFVQDNISRSHKSVIRGLHFQNPPHPQGKAVTVVKGSVLDVAVDIRKESPTYGKYVSVELSEQNKRIFWIPAGFAHGFIAREDDTVFMYKCTDNYDPKSEVTIAWDDKDINIDWQCDSPIVSDRDNEGVSFSDFKSLF